MHSVFLQLTSLGKVSKLNHLLQSPFTLAKGIHSRIDQELENHKNGKPAHIIAKMNQLVEPETIRALYRASQGGVKIDLLVRGMCSVRPGVPGVSENITVRSVIGRFLEHTRVFYFENGGEPDVWLSSADWMERNFYRRVEVAFPLRDLKLRKRVVRELRAYLADSAQSWELQPDGRYEKLKHRSNAKAVQIKLLEQATGS